MSRLTSGWDVGRSLGRCSITGAQLEPGARIVAALVDDATSAAGLRRVEVAAEAWDAGGRPEHLFAFWRTEVPALGVKRRAFVDDGALLDLFERLGNDERPHRVGFRFVLMLLLVRKRLLRVLGQRDAAAGERWIVAPKGGPENDPGVEVVNPKLDDAAMQEITEQLGEVLDGEWS